ncbi:helix-turn-helix domain-containing protein [Wolbachia pipientis]|uniref:helix-turn-helix transcriptional regulator n=1 Tax=Wolbachia pipientis TaxID=955 RepID=UPI001F2E72C8|nr:helix-turn-helix transcriptional regulator [Wolbachia pipientis]UIP91277.1 helix-turn-helix domain-containing protein [Wolbachia pipientis]
MKGGVRQKIKELRLYCGLTQTELGKKIGVSYRQIQRYENSSNQIWPVGYTT